MRRRTFRRTLAGLGGVLGGWAVFVFAASYADADLGRAIGAGTAPLFGIVGLYAGSAFQRRSGFLESLRREWLAITEAKTAMVLVCRASPPSVASALDAWARLSIVIDRMRVVYGNVGETETLIGYYPYEPLHDMRRLWEEQILARGEDLPAASRSDLEAVENQIVASFQAMRETFLDELDLEPPTTPIIVRGRLRRKRVGAAMAQTPTDT